MTDKVQYGQVSQVEIAENALSQEDRVLISKIAKRASIEFGLPAISTALDLTIVHANCVPLLLQEMLDDQTDNFAHDIYGIRGHLNRETGKLENFFEPRFTDYGRRSSAVE